MKEPRVSEPNATPTVSMPQSLLDEVDQWAEAKGWTRSFLVREAVREFLIEVKIRSARHESETGVRSKSA